MSVGLLRAPQPRQLLPGQARIERGTHPDINCSSKNFPCDSLVDIPGLGADPGGVGTCWGAGGPTGGSMGCGFEEGDATAPKSDRSAFCLSCVWFAGPETLEEIEPACPDAGVAGPECGGSCGP